MNLINKLVYGAVSKYMQFLEKMQDNTFYAPGHSNWCGTNFAEFAECDCGGGSSPNSPKNRRK